MYILLKSVYISKILINNYILELDTNVNTKYKINLNYLNF